VKEVLGSALGVVPDALTELELDGIAAGCAGENECIERLLVWAGPA
jgi:hypothetical protein